MKRLLLIALLVLSHGTVYAEWMRVSETVEGMSAFRGWTSGGSLHTGEVAVDPHSAGG